MSALNAFYSIYANPGESVPQKEKKIEKRCMLCFQFDHYNWFLFLFCVLRKNCSLDHGGLSCSKE